MSQHARVHTDDLSADQGAVELVVDGMTCASCAARIEKKLNRMPGVRASVNYATERAHVVLPADTTVEDAIGAIEATGYTAALLPPRAKGTEDAGPDDGRVASLRRRLLVSAVLTAPVLLLAMVTPLQFDNWQWLSLILAAPVAVWARGRSMRRRGKTFGTAPRRWTR